MSMAPADFITVTAPRTLPPLFANCDAKAIEAVSREVEQTASALFLANSHVILAYIFMLPKPAESKAISFVLKILADASQEGPIDLQVVVKVSLVKILAELVVAMGDENETKVPVVRQTKFLLLNFGHNFFPLIQAVDAMKRVERIINSTGKERNKTPVELSGFLKVHMLGLMSYINEMLQDMQGKKSVASKRKIIKGLGELIVQIGSNISYGAPQVFFILSLHRPVIENHH